MPTEITMICTVLKGQQVRKSAQIYTFKRHQNKRLHTKLNEKNNL